MKFQGKDGVLRIYNLVNGYLEVHFSNMDFSGPIGRPKLEEILVLDQGRVSKYSHYITGDDMKIFDPLTLSFSCFVDDITHVNTTNGFKEVLVEALQCRDARNDQSDDTWTAYGVSTKGSTQNISGVYNPRFEQLNGTPTTGLEVDSVTDNTLVCDSVEYDDDEVANSMILFKTGAAAGKALECYRYASSTHTYTFSPDIVSLASEYGIAPGDEFDVYDNIRTVDIQFKLTGESNSIVWAFHEVYFPLQECTLTESEESVSMALTGGIYGTITRHSDWQ